MKSNDIFIGTIKRCKDLESYKKYGEEHFFCDFIICKTEIGLMYRYVDIIDEKAILIKVNETEYIWLDTLTNKFDEFLVNLGIPVKTIYTEPYCNNSLFVDEKTLVPVFKNTNDSLNVKKVKTLVPPLKK